MSSEKSSRLGDKEKKALTIIIPVVLAVVLVVVGAVTFFANSEKGREVSSNAEKQFQTITVPEDSSQLTAVSEAPVGKPDKSDDKHIGVDLLGNPVKQANIPGSQDTSSRKPQDKNSSQKPQRNAPKTTERKPSAEEMKQVSNVGKRVKIPSLNADFALGTLQEPASGVIEPTNFTSVFWITNRGVKYDNTKNGTAYLAAHALDQNAEGSGLSGLAPGNWLYDPMTKESKLQPGDVIEVGGVKFAFEEFHRAGKGLIARDKDIWDEKKPNRLIFLTCIGNSNDNGIFTFRKL